MGKTINSGIGVGTPGSPQTSLEQREYDSKVNELDEIENEKNNLKKFDSSNFDFNDSKQKIESYLLNVDHPQGGSKAKFFVEILGFSKSNSHYFFETIRDAINGKIPTRTTETNYGIVHEFHEKIKSVTGHPEFANIVVVIQKDHGKYTFRIITAYPDKKGL